MKKQPSTHGKKSLIIITTRLKYIWYTAVGFFFLKTSHIIVSKSCTLVLNHVFIGPILSFVLKYYRSFTISHLHYWHPQKTGFWVFFPLTHSWNHCKIATKDWNSIHLNYLYRWPCIKCHTFWSGKNPPLPIFFIHHKPCCCLN